MIRVLVVQRILPPYRVAFFAHLAQSADIDLSIAHGEPRPRTGLRNASQPPRVTRRTLLNRYWQLFNREIAVYQAGMLKEIAKNRYDVVVAEFNPRIISNVLGLFVARRRRVPFIWWGMILGPNTGQIAARIKLYLARRADAVIFYGRAEAKRFIEMGYDRSRVFVAPNTIDTEAVARLAKEQPRSIRDRILYVGRLVERKKVDVVLRAAAQLARTQPTLRTTIIGDGPERQSLEDLAASLGLEDRVEFTGEIYDLAVLAAHFNSAIVSVSAGAVGLSCAQALAAGVPMIVARDEPHGPEREALIEGRTAVYVPSNDPDSIADAIDYLLRNPTEWTRMSDDANAIASQQFGVGQMVEGFIDAIRFAQRAT
jgi:glycosyltransferase involved in cell wall biosynthesis